MAGSWGEIGAGRGNRGRLRASHADRELVIVALKAAFVRGMLAKDEFDLRVGQALASRTYAELAALTADLPPEVASAKLHRSGPARYGQPAVRPGRVIEAATGIYGFAWAYVFFLSPYGGETPWTNPLLFEGLVVYLGVLIICIAAIVANRRDRHSAGQPPRRRRSHSPASRRPPSAGPGGQVPSAHPDHWQTAEIAPG